MQLSFSIRETVAAVLAAATVAVGCAQTQAPVNPTPASTSPTPSILVDAELPREAARGEQIDIPVHLTTSGPGTVEVELAADAVSLRAMPERPLGSVSEDVIWTVEHVTVMPSVPAIASRTTLSPNESRPLPPLRVEVDLPTGSYSLRACVRLRTDPMASPSTWCSASSSFVVS